MVRIRSDDWKAQREKGQERFKAEVMADTHKLINDGVNELIWWMVDRNLKQWSSILEYANLRCQANFDGEIVSDVDDGFEYYCNQILSSMGADARGWWRTTATTRSPNGSRPPCRGPSPGSPRWKRAP